MTGQTAMVWCIWISVSAVESISACSKECWEVRILKDAQLLDLPRQIFGKVWRNMQQAWKYVSSILRKCFFFEKTACTLLGQEISFALCNGADRIKILFVLFYQPQTKVFRTQKQNKLSIFYHHITYQPCHPWTSLPCSEVLQDVVPAPRTVLMIICHRSLR